MYNVYRLLNRFLYLMPYGIIPLGDSTFISCDASICVFLAFTMYVFYALSEITK